MAGYNLKCPAVKRLMREAAELRDPSEEFYAQPLEDNLFEWHFTIRGPPNTDFDGGFYHGRISLPTDYPMKPPSIILLTPNGRFEVNKKICLSISGHHPESWQPSWSIRTALLAIIGFMPTHGKGAIGALDYSPEERRYLAIRSRDWHCPECGCIRTLLEREESSEECSANDDKKPDQASPEGAKVSSDNDVQVTRRRETVPSLREDSSEDEVIEANIPSNEVTVKTSFSWSLIIMWVLIAVFVCLLDKISVFEGKSQA